MGISRIESEFGFVPNELSSEIFISAMPVKLIEENIITQFDDPLEHRKNDFIVTFINIYRYSLENVDAYEDEDKDNVIELRDDFYSFMLQIFRQYLGIGFVDFEEMSMEDQDDMIHYVYRFFIMNGRKNFICYILNYLDNHRDDFVISDDKQKDITSLSLKKEVTDPVDLYIISNLSDIINQILHEDISVDDFFKWCDGNESTLETRFMSNQYDNMKITGNFVEKYVEMIDIDFLFEIETKVRNKILKKYKKKSS